METSLIFSVILALCGITLASSKKLTNEELRVLYNTPVDTEEFTSNIFMLPAPQQLYVYEYLRDLVKNLEESAKMATFVQASLKRLQQKIDDFNQENKLEKVSVKKFLLKRIYLQLKGSCKKPDTGKTTNESRPSLEKSSPVNKPANSQSASIKNTNDIGSDPKSKPKDSKEPLSTSNQEKTLKKSTSIKSKNKLDSSAEEKSPTKKETVSNSSSNSKVSDKKSPPLSTSTPIAQRIQPPLPANPLNFTMRFDKPGSKGLKKSPSKPEPESTQKEPKQLTSVEPATSKKPMTQTQSQDKKSSNSKSSKTSPRSSKIQNVPSKTETEGPLSFSV